MSLDYVIQELEGRKLECDEGITEQQAKVRQAEVHLQQTKIQAEKMITHYTKKMLELRQALMILKEEE